jgi:regulator of chromosome condensation
MIYLFSDTLLPSYPAHMLIQHLPCIRAHQPRQAIDLDLIPGDHFTKIASSSLSYAAAALTSTNDVYLWGMSPPGSSPTSSSTSNSTSTSDSASASNVNSNFNFQLTDEAVPLDLYGLDIRDVAIGETHMLVLTTDGRVWVRGEGRNGQLGLGKGVERSEWCWTCVDLRLPERREVVGVVAGPRSSFVLVRVRELNEW